MWPYFAMTIAASLSVWGGSRAEKRIFGRRGEVILFASYVIAGAIFCYFAGARDYNVGGDIHVYADEAFHSALNLDFADYFAKYAGWCPLSKIVFWGSANVSRSFFWYLFAIELVYVTPTLVAIRLLLKDLGYMGVFVFGILLFPLSLNLMRQTMAMGFVLLSYAFVQKRKPLFFVLLIVIAALFHETALAALLIYPLYLIGASDRGTIIAKYLIAAACVIAVILVLPVVFDLITPFAGKYTSYANGTFEEWAGPIKLGPIKVATGSTLLYICIGLIYYGFLRKAQPNAGRDLELCGMAFVIFCGTASIFCGMITSPLYRFGLYFMILGIVLLPKLTERFQKRPWRHTFEGIIVFVLSGYSVCYYVLGDNLHSIYPYALAMLA